ncbi:thermonuclease family protein [Nocardioides sp. PD653]|uniref:thermonuclease family protein n=1 Tax=Nocardioides sp. PD653 TaxID=393303 RepID=UPI0009F0210C|nr:thermonuclease family protein [Nocardioides sp. PD653]GAW54776.1 thermonuclease family protein [Nocardioides sp. PD653]
MIASKPVRLVSLAIVALIIVVGCRGILSGVAFGGNLLDGHGGHTTGTNAKHEGGTRTQGEVAYVLDGDTVQVSTSAGRSVRVRFLGISAPEIPHPGKAGECYGYPSTRHLKKLLPVGTHVTLVSDPTQDNTDVYGRVLRYVQARRRDIGAAQIRAGAAASRDSSNPVTRHASYVQLEGQARDRGRGMWTACASH